MKTAQDFIKTFTDKKIGDIKQIGNRYYLVNENVWKTKENIQDNPFSIGTLLGEVKPGQDKFKPSLALLEILSKESDKKIFVNDKSEWLFLCGRDVFAEGILQELSRHHIVNNNTVLVQNKNDENLGLGLVEFKEKPMIKNILDRGSFLRREKQK